VIGLRITLSNPAMMLRWSKCLAAKGIAASIEAGDLGLLGLRDDSGKTGDAGAVGEVGDLESKL
jgi:hypothetical protein